VKTQLPNFLIVGFPKCGTTSLVNTLGFHHDIFIPDKKELRFFTHDLLKEKGFKGPGDKKTKRLVISSWEGYKNQFMTKKPFTAIGEATTDTAYYYNTTIPNIKKRLGDPKIIIVLRDPVDRAISAYSHLIRDDREKLSFEEAIKKEKCRLNKGYESIWAYSNGGMYYHSVESFLKNFSQVKVILFEDLKDFYDKTVKETFSFLDVDENIAIRRHHNNKSGISKNKLLNKFLNESMSIKDIIKKVIGINNAMEIKDFFQNINVRKIEIDNDQKDRLRKHHLDDINNLEKLINKDLSNWKSQKNT